MADRTSAETFAKQLLKIGLVTDAQIKDALYNQGAGIEKE
jgi:hypothetical protein